MKVLQGLFLIIGLVVTVNAQKITVQGVVIDPQANVIVDAKVTAINSQKEIFKTVTGKDGVYRFEIIPGDYEIRFEQSGFKTLKFRTFHLVKGRIGNPILMVDAVLEVGSADDAQLMEVDNDLTNGKIICITQPVTLPVDSTNKKIKQEISALVKGLATDETGAVVPFLTIDFQDVNGKIIQTKSDDRGEYIIKLPQGVFTISAKIEVNSLLLKSKETKIEIKSSDGKTQDLILYCIKGNCPIITSSGHGG